MAAAQFLLDLIKIMDSFRHCFIAIFYEVCEIIVHLATK